MNQRLRVMLTTEGTYPFHRGGVSTWCHLFVDRLKPVDFVIYSIMMNPYLSQKFALRPDTQLIKVPLWGTEDPSEHLSLPFSEVYLHKRKTDARSVREHFLPLFDALIKEIFSRQKDPRRFGQTLQQLYQYFRIYDYRESFTAEEAWTLFKRTAIGFSESREQRLAEPSIFDTVQSLGWLYRFLTILNTPVPKVDVAHSAAAAFCGVPCVLAKLEHDTPFLLTEHGVYLREQYLSLQQRGYSTYLNTFLVRLIQSVSNLSYAYADQISPVCQFNTRWEQVFGVPPSKTRVIYNGVDEEIFSAEASAGTREQLTVVSVARVDPAKDIVTLIQAAAVVLRKLPTVKFVVYGSISVPEYYQQCQQLLEQLDLRSSFILAGHSEDMPAAYQSGDVIALSSITEGFPYSVVEAMMSGKAVVATDVGGVREALSDCGILVRPRQVEELAEALLRLLADAGLRQQLGVAARLRAAQYFTVERALSLYWESYRRLAGQRRQASTVSTEQSLLIDRGYALASLAHYPEAVDQFRRAIAENPRSPATPVLLAEIAEAYNRLGLFDQAFHELAKAETLIEIMQDIPA